MNTDFIRLIPYSDVQNLLFSRRVTLVRSSVEDQYHLARASFSFPLLPTMAGLLGFNELPQVTWF
jgi:hypothetical protein